MRSLPLVSTLLLGTGCIPSTPSSPPELPADSDVQSTATAAPVEVQPLPEPTESRYAATHVLIAWKGAANAPPSATLDRATAEERATKLHAQAVSGHALEPMATEHSDAPSGPRGGGVGVYATGTMMPAFERAIASVGVGEVAPLIETPYGFHIARRDPVVEAHLAHVQVAWSGAWRANTQRSKGAARARAEAAHAALVRGTPLATVAKQYSDDPSASVNAGDLGLVAPGQLVPAFERAAFALQRGEISDVVETRYGFHVIQRIE